MLGKLQAHRQTLLSPEFDDDELDGIIVHTVNTIKKQLNYVLETPCYKWSLKWAPTYSALTIAFASESLSFDTLVYQSNLQSCFCLQGNAPTARFG